MYTRQNAKFVFVILPEFARQLSKRYRGHSRAVALIGSENLARRFQQLEGRPPLVLRLSNVCRLKPREG